MKAVRLLVLAVALAVVASALAQEGKEVTLKGTITCAKCDLKKQKTCHTVIKVKEGDKEVIYYFDKDANKKNHSQICTEAKEGEVKGSVSKDGDKNMVKVTKVEFK
jgi:hypothetical protein